MNKVPSIVLLALVSLVSVYGHDVISSDITVKNVDRSIDLTSQLVKVTCKITFENGGKSSISKLLFALEPEVKSALGFIGAAVSGSSKKPLPISETTVSGKNEQFWRITLQDPIKPGSSTIVEVEYILTDSINPYPTSISQKEKQLVRYNGNVYFYSPYITGKQTTSVNLGTRNIESYTKFNPVAQQDYNLNYGPYSQIPAFSKEPLLVHYENNSPFLKVTRIERVIEVSHWGNIAVEETIDIVHTGAVLKGPFSRYEFQREALSGLSSVKSFKTILPASASDVYYRDDIGNISTSHMKLLSDSVELDLRPRFPLFGGWKTHYTLGYNVPSYEYLYNQGDNYKLKMRVIDHIFDDMIVEELVTKIILPEGSDNIRLTAPYTVTRLPDSRHFTYLDIKGRPVISITKSNLVENHIQEFDLDYVFPRILMLQEPLMVVVALYILFILVTIYVRLDFSISKDEVGESRMRVSGLIDKLLFHQDIRSNVYRQMDDLLSKLKSTKDVNSFLSSMKSQNQEYKNETAQIAELITKLKPDAPDLIDKVSELQKVDKHLRDIYTQKQSLYVDKLIPSKIGRNPFLEAEAAINKKRDDAIEKINAIVKTIH